MSFIYENKYLISELLKAAQAQPVAPAGTPAPVDPKTNVEFQNYLNLSKKLTDQLQKSYGFVAPDPNEAAEVAAENKADIKVPDLNTLGNFFEFIAKNKITVDGKRVVYLDEENPTDITYKPIDAERSVALAQEDVKEGQRTQIRGAYYANQDLLVKYVYNLLENASKQPPREQQFIKVMLGALLEKINKIYGTKLTTEYKKPGKILPDNTLLATFTEPLDMATYTTEGPNKLTFGDIKDGTALQKWINRVSIKGGDKVFPPLDKDANGCIAVQVIWARASFMVDRKIEEKVEGQNQIFKDKITETGKSITGPDGKPCALSTTKPGGSTSGGGSGTGVTDQDLQNIVSILPLDDDDIDFTRINNFFAAFRNLLDKGNIADKSYIESNMKAAEKFMTDALTLGNRPRVEMNMSWLELKHILALVPGTPVGQKYSLFLEQMQGVVEQTSSVVSHLYAKFVRKSNAADQRPQAIFNSQQRAEVESQINEKKVRNLRDLQTLANDRSKVVDIK